MATPCCAGPNADQLALPGALTLPSPTRVGEGAERATSRGRGAILAYTITLRHLACCPTDAPRHSAPLSHKLWERGGGEGMRVSSSRSQSSDVSVPVRIAYLHILVNISTARNRVKSRLVRYTGLADSLSNIEWNRPCCAPQLICKRSIDPWHLLAERHCRGDELDRDLVDVELFIVEHRFTSGSVSSHGPVGCSNRPRSRSQRWGRPLGGKPLPPMRGGGEGAPARPWR